MVKEFLAKFQMASQNNQSFVFMQYFQRSIDRRFDNDAEAAQVPLTV